MRNAAKCRRACAERPPADHRHQDADQHRPEKAAIAERRARRKPWPAAVVRLMFHPLSFTFHHPSLNSLASTCVLRSVVQTIHLSFTGQVSSFGFFQSSTICFEQQNHAHSQRQARGRRAACCFRQIRQFVPVGGEQRWHLVSIVPPIPAIRSPRRAETLSLPSQPFHGLIEHAVNLAHPGHRNSGQRPVHAPDEVMQAAASSAGQAVQRSAARVWGRQSVMRYRGGKGQIAALAAKIHEDSSGSSGRNLEPFCGGRDDMLAKTGFTAC